MAGNAGEPASRSSPTWTRSVLLTGVLVGVADYAIGLGTRVIRATLRRWNPELNGSHVPPRT